MEWERADAEFKRLVEEVENAQIPVELKEKVLRFIAQEQLVANFDFTEWGPTLEKALVFFRKMHKEARREDRNVPEWNAEIENAWWNNAVVESFFIAGMANQLERSLHVKGIFDEGMRKVCFSILARGDAELPAIVTEYGQRAARLRERSQLVVMITTERLSPDFAKYVRGPAGGKGAKGTVH
jgi:hypothetical protein